MFLLMFFLLCVRESSMMTRCFSAYEPPVKYLKTTSTCSKSLIPATGVEMYGAASLKLQGTKNMYKYTYTTVTTTHNGETRKGGLRKH